MKIKEHGAAREEYVFILGDFHLLVFCVIRQVQGLYTRGLIAMISLNIFQDIIASCRVSIKILNLFAELFHPNIYIALNED